jgi:hypothetical protein
MVRRGTERVLKIYLLSPTQNNFGKVPKSHTVTSGCAVMRLLGVRVVAGVPVHSY